MRRKRHPIHRFIVLVVSRPRATLAVTLVLAALSIVLAVKRLTVSADQNKLFSGDVPFFRDFLEFDRKFPENEAIYVVVQAKGDERGIALNRWTGVADAIAERVGGLTEDVKGVHARVPLGELGNQALLFEDPAKVPQIRREAEGFVPLVQLFLGSEARYRLLGATPIDRLLGGVRFQPAKDTAGFMEVVAKSWTATLSAPQSSTRPVVTPDLVTLGASDPYALGYSYLPDETDRSRHVLLVAVYPKYDFTSLTAVSESVETIRSAVADAAKAYPEFKVGVTGRPAMSADEMRTTDDDSHKAEAVALTAVFIGVALLLRSFWLALAAELALGVGIAWTFAWATLTLGELNLLSIVFLLALIGIGMDYLVQILSRYRVERGRRGRPVTVWVAVFRQVGPPINTACLGAAGAFLVSLFTDFQGAADLGLIAGGGLILCLLAGYAFLPALLTVWPGRFAQVTERGQEPLRTGANVGNEVKAPDPLAPRWRWWVGPVVWAVVLAGGLPFAMRTRFDPSLIKLQADNLESVKLIRRLQTWSAVVLSKDLEALRGAREALRGAPTVGRTESVLSAYDNYEFLKGRPLPAVEWTTPAAVPAVAVGRIAGQAEGLAGFYESAGSGETGRALRAFAGALREADAGVAAGRLSEWEGAFVAEVRRLLGQFDPPTPDLAKAPAQIREHLVSADGTYALYIYPKGDLWRQAELNRFIEDVEPRVGPLKGRVVLTGIAHNIYHSTGAIRSSFYRATFYALGLIVVLVLIDLRSVSHTLAAVGVLGLGLPMLVGLMGVFHVNWNFANFFGLPILIGAGHEYGVFMVHRYREGLRDPVRRAWGRWDVADSALLLCAFVTSSSFGFFFLLAHHKGLKSLGLVMALGTACIYLGTVVAVRPVLRWRLARLK